MKQLSPATIRTASGYRSPLQRKGFKRVGKKKAAGIKNKKRSCGCLEESRACSLSRRNCRSVSFIPSCMECHGQVKHEPAGDTPCRNSQSAIGWAGVWQHENSEC
ncbi:hypothetical protein AAA147_21320 [Phocaeicola vulgatus]|uniref:hypothetical protein n=1 Tax=Phocaeicola vulgatus TaxID=821 RepID=UPI0032C115DF